HRRKIRSRALARDHQPIEITAEARRIATHPIERAAHVLNRGRKAVPRREPIADVEYEIAAARVREAHDPMRVFAEDAKTASMDVDDDRYAVDIAACERQRAVNVEPVLGEPALVVSDVADHFYVVTFGIGVRVQ